jgi:hypothetical protein
MNYIEQLQAKLDNLEARQHLDSLVKTAPVISDWIVDPDVRQKNEQINQWAETEWDYEHGMSRLEYQQQQELAALRVQLNSRGEGMELYELNEHLGRFIKDNGLMTKAEVDAIVTAKEQAFNNELNMIGTLATRIPYLNAKYQKDFGEVFDPDDFVSKAVEKGYHAYGKQGLEKFYDEFTAEKRESKQKADIEARIEAARAEERQKIQQEVGMGQNGRMPTLDGSPEMGHFEAKLKGMASKPAEGTSSAPADAELGRGVIARFAAQAADARDRAQAIQ